MCVCVVLVGLLLLLLLLCVDVDMRARLLSRPSPAEEAHLHLAAPGAFMTLPYYYRAAEQAMREEEMEAERRRLEDATRRAGAAGGGADVGVGAGGKGAVKNDKIELKWSWSAEGGGKLVSEPVERKGPKKPIRFAPHCRCMRPGGLETPVMPGRLLRRRRMLCSACVWACAGGRMCVCVGALVCVFV